METLVLPPAPDDFHRKEGFRERFVYKLFANIFANELFVTIINRVVLISTT